MKDLIVSSPAFENKGLIPIQYTGYGADTSPELILSGLDARAESLVVIMNDRGHPIPGYNHWVIWNIPPALSIPANIPHGSRVDTLGGAVQGVGYGKHRYRGPKPPFHWSHMYEFYVYVLDSKLDIPDNSRKRDLLKAMQGKILQQGVLSGHYR